MLKLGYKASAEQFAPSKLLDFSILAEQVGLDSAFVSDHFQPWKHIDGHAPGLTGRALITSSMSTARTSANGIWTSSRRGFASWSPSLTRTSRRC